MNSISNLKLQSNEKCAICLNNITEQTGIIKTSCGHFYHLKCASGWLVNNDSCPMCRKILTENEQIGEIFQDTVNEYEKKIYDMKQYYDYYNDSRYEEIMKYTNEIKELKQKNEELKQKIVYLHNPKTDENFSDSLFSMFQEEE